MNVMPMEELKRQLLMFHADSKRGISWDHFCELAGVSPKYALAVVRGEHSMTEYMQRRLDKALREWREGKVVVMIKRNGERYFQYRREAKPIARRNFGLIVEGGQIKLKVGLRQRGDYSARTLDELLD